MSNEINFKLKEAKKLYNSKKYVESLEIYEELFNESPEEFELNDKISYSWAVYQVHIKNFENEYEFLESSEFITELIPQADLNRLNTCPYTFSVMKVLDYLHDKNEYYNMFYWFDKLNPELLSEKRNNFKGRVLRSKKEKYYDYITKAYLECADWELCIKTSKNALESLKSFTNDADTWYRWRIAKSLKEIKQNNEALKYLNEVLKVKKEWYVFKEFAENYCMLNEYEKAMEYIPNAILTNDPINIKVNLFYLIYVILKDSDFNLALKHAQLYYLIKLDSNAEISEDIEDLQIDETILDKDELKREIDEHWKSFKFKNQELQYGTVTKYFDDKNYGFITNEKNESIFFHKNQFEGDNLYVGILVSFYTEKSFDKSKNKESINAVNIRGE